MNTATTTVSNVAAASIDANGYPVHPNGRLPRAEYMEWLKATGQYKPFTDAEKAERDQARAAKKATEKAATGATEAAPARKPVSEAQRRFYAAYHARKRRAAVATAAA